MYNIEWYDRNIGVPVISISSYGLTLNQSVISILPKDTKAVNLGLDIKNKIICISPVTDKTDSGFPINIDNSKGVIRIYTREFIRYVQLHTKILDLSKTEKYVVLWDEEHKIIVLDLYEKIRRSKDTE